MAQKEVSNYYAQNFEFSAETSTIMKKTKDPYIPATLKFSAFSFKDQLSHIEDHLWEKKFSVEGLRTTRSWNLE